MHLASLYALATGSKIDKPYIKTAFYPTPEKYITVNLSSHMVAKLYDYWDLVIQFILPDLNKNNIKIIQLGGKDEKPLANCINLLGQTSLAQSSYIIQNALVHVGADSALSHVSSAFNTPMVTLFSVSAPTICGAFWGDTDKQINLEPNFKNGWYSFNPQENPKSVNSIKVEDVINSIGKLLNIYFPKIETVFIGPKYNALTSELIPNCQIPVQYFPNQLVNLRLDFCAELTPEILNNTYSTIFARPASIRTNREIDINPIIQNPQIKKNLAGIVLDLENDSFSEEYVKSLLDNQIKFILAYGGGDEEFLKKLKLKFCEYGVIQKFEKENVELKKIIDNPSFSPENKFIKTNRIIVNDSKLFTCKCALDDKLSVEQTQNLELKMSTLRNWRDLAQDGDFLYIYSVL